MSFWRKANGKLICNENGKLINCDHCPCEAQPYPCNDWLLEVSGQPVLYNISLSMTANHITHFHYIYGEEGEEQEEEIYDGEEVLTMTASISNVPASSVISGGFNFHVSSVNGHETSRYEFHAPVDYVEIQETTETLSSIVGGGCPVDYPDPESFIPDDGMHGWQFVCNENAGQFYYRVSPSVGTCYGMKEEYYETPWGTEDNTYESPVSVGVILRQVTFPARSARATYVQGDGYEGYVMTSNNIHLSAEEGDISGDNYEATEYNLTMSFSPIIPGDN